MDARFYNAEDIDIERLANDLEQKYRIQGYEVQQIGNKDQMTVQLKKGGDLAALVGMQTALSVIIQHMSGGTVAMIGQQKWIDKAAVGAVGLVAAPVLWPLMLTAGAGAIRQASLGNQVLNEVDWLVRQQKPEVRLGPLPGQVMPQIQQQWAPPPAQFYPATPVYMPSASVYIPTAQPMPPVQPVQPMQPPPAQRPAPARVSLRCPNCNTPYEEGDTFCSGCGRTLKTLCPNCKTEIKPGVAFCPKCGSSVFQALSGTQAAISPVQPAPVTSTVNAPTVYPQPPKPQPQPKQPYVPPTPKTPPVVPQPTITYIPGSSKPASPPPPKPNVPVYIPSKQPDQPALPPIPTYTPPVQQAQPTVQTNVSPNEQTLPGPRPSIKARPMSEPVSSAGAVWGKLIFSNEKEVMLSGEQMLIGRVDHDVQGISPDVDLSDLPGADTTSRIHATIEHVGSLYSITDLNSTNATRVNGKRVEPDKATAINDGDTLLFGKVSCTFKKV